MQNISKKLESFNLSINLEIKGGEIFGLLGKSGSGKTTILKLLQKTILPDKGEIVLEDNQKISTIFQEFNLLNNKTVFENVALPLFLNKKYSIDKINESLLFVGMLDKKNMYPVNLSGGEKQRVAIARAIVTNPNILLCDEPTASLDKETSEDILKLFKKINKKYKTTIIIVTHELDIAKKMCNRVAVIEEGIILDIFKIIKNQDTIKNMNYLEYVKEKLNV